MSAESTELRLYIDNESALHGQYESIRKNLATKKVRSIYKHDLAVKLFGYLVEAGAKKYAKDYLSIDWHRMFPVATRKEVAEDLTRSFERAFENGEYDYLLPKKYQKELSKKNLVPPHPRVKPSKDVSAHATRKKSAKWKAPGSLKIVWSVPNSAFFALWPGRGPVKDQQVLKVASAEDMHEWLRSTYGPAYGLAGRTSSSSGHARKKTATRAAMGAALEKAFAPGGLCSTHGCARRHCEDRHPLATYKSPAQLEREIKHVLRGGR